MFFKYKNCVYLDALNRGIFEGKDFSTITISCPYRNRCIANCPRTETELEEMNKAAEQLKMGQKYWVLNNIINNNNNNF